MGMIVGWEWMWRRTKRLADLLLQPHILAGAVQMVEAMDRYCEENDLPESGVVLGDAIFIKGLCYVEFPLEREG